MSKSLTTPIFFILILFLSCRLSAGTVEHVYHFGAPSVVKFADGQAFNFNNTLMTGLPGEPVLPYEQVKLMLPPGEKADKIEIIGSGEVQLEGNFYLPPQQQVRPLSKGASGEYLKNSDIYNSSVTYPLSPSGHLITSFLNGHSFALSTFTPLHYIPASGKVSYYSTVRVIIHTSASAEAQTAMSMLRQDEFTGNELSRFSDNPEMLDSYQADRQVSADDYEILVITSTLYQLAFADLQAAYLQEGLRLKVATTDNIYSTMTGIDLQERMRNYIIQEYQQHGIQYVILGGDDEIVPHRGFFCHVQSSSVYEDNDIPADLYYSSLDGNWNTDGDNMWGEPEEDDLLPDISVGRLSFSNIDELLHMLHKSYSYQFTPVPGEFQKVLMAGENLYNDPETWGSDYLELLIGFRNDNGYTTSGLPASYNFNKMYDENSQWNGDDLIYKLNQGYPMLNHSGHANQTYVMKLSNWDITDQNFYNVNGTVHNYALVYTHGCDCGSFDYDDCIAEQMVSIGNFAAAFIGNSRYGWFNEGQTEGPSAHLHREFMDALFTDKLNRVGTAHAESKRATAPWVTAPGQWEPGAIRWCFYDCNVLGDPAMAVWTNNAYDIQTEYPSTIPVGATAINVHVQANGVNVKNLSCVMLMNGSFLGKSTTDSLGNATVTFSQAIMSPGTAQLVVSGYNCLPTAYSVTVNNYTGCKPGTEVMPLLTVCPNPVAGELQIRYELKSPGSVSVWISSTDGKEWPIKCSGLETSGMKTEKWDASQLPSGIYTCSVRIGNSIVSQRFVKR